MTVQEEDVHYPGRVQLDTGCRVGGHLESSAQEAEAEG